MEISEKAGQNENSDPLVSIITIYYNRAELVSGSVDSIVSQNFDGDYEVILVDDGSTDDTLARLKEYEDERTRVVHTSNIGLTNAIRLGIEKSRGKYIAVHGSGDYSFPDRIARQVEVLEANPDVGVVGCWYEQELLGRGEFVEKKRPQTSDFRAAMMEANIFSHGEVMYRRDVYEKVGGYRPFFTYAQDCDLWLRMSEHCHYHIVPEILYRRLSPAGTVRADPVKVLIQQYLAEIARQCSTQRSAGERDMVDKHGPHAHLFVRSSKKLGNHLVDNGVSHVINLDDPRGNDMIRQGVRHSRTIRNTIYSVIPATYGSPTYRKLIRPMFKKWRRWRG